MNIIKRILALFGFEVVYVSEWGTHDTRYGSLERMMTRPIHKDMGIAPPWAKMVIRRIAK